MRGYIEWLAPKADSLKDFLFQKFKDYRQRAQKDDSHLRMAEIVAWLQIGYEMFLDYAISCNAFPDGERESAQNKALDIFMELAARQTAQIISNTPVSQFLLALSEMLTSKVYSCSSFVKDRSVGALKGPGFLGYRDDQNFYLLPDYTIAAVREFYRKQGICFSIQKNTLLKQLSSVGAIRETVSQGRVHRTIVKFIDGENQRFICLKKEALDKLTQPDVGDDDDDDFVEE